MYRVAGLSNRVYSLTMVDGELNDLAHLAAQRVRFARSGLVQITALHRQLLRRNVLGAARVIVAVALEAPDCRTCECNAGAVS